MTGTPSGRRPAFGRRPALTPDARALSEEHVRELARGGGRAERGGEPRHPAGWRPRPLPSHARRPAASIEGASRGGGDGTAAPQVSGQQGAKVGRSPARPRMPEAGVPAPQRRWTQRRGGPL